MAQGRLGTEGSLGQREMEKGAFTRYIRECYFDFRRASCSFN